VMLLLLILSMVYGFKVHKWAAYLMVLYLIWTIIMSIYLWEIIFLNYIAPKVY